jgi:hypothetical protein
MIAGFVKVKTTAVIWPENPTATGNRAGPARPSTPATQSEKPVPEGTLEK